MYLFRRIHLEINPDEIDEWSFRKVAGHATCQEYQSTSPDLNYLIRCAKFNVNSSCLMPESCCRSITPPGEIEEPACLWKGTVSGTLDYFGEKRILCRTSVAIYNLDPRYGCRWPGKDFDRVAISTQDHRKAIEVFEKLSIQSAG